MNAALKIQKAVERVDALRREAAADPDLAQAGLSVKRLQNARFRGTYADLLQSGPYRVAARFFLDEIYGERDTSQRDAQFSRIASALERLFPAQVTQTAVTLAELHALTEALDHATAVALLEVSRERGDAVFVASPSSYASAWGRVGHREERLRQLDAVSGLGRELHRITRLPGLRLMLRMMRGPAQAAGMSALQAFLEAGFDTFAAMARAPGGVDRFLRTIEERERAFIAAMFDADAVACETLLTHTLGQAR